MANANKLVKHKKKELAGKSGPERRASKCKKYNASDGSKFKAERGP